MNLVGFDYENKKDKELTKLFIESKTTKKYILGINKLTKSVLKYIDVDGVIDDFTRLQSSRKKGILKIEDVPKDSIILSTASGSPIEVKKALDSMGYTNFNYLSFLRFSKLDLPQPMFMGDFEDDFKENEKEYENIFNLLSDEKSKEIFTSVLNFKMTYDLEFMNNFTNNHDGQYFDLEYLPKIDKVRFVDGGGYTGDTLPNIIKNYPDFEKIYLVEPNSLHMNIAKKNFEDISNIEFINCGLGLKKILSTNDNLKIHNCDHNYQANNIDSIDNIINEKIDFIKLDIEGAEQDALIGASKTIDKYHPVLAICIYHKAEDWYKIPKIVLDIRDDYSIYLRHYMEGIFETIMYFIPKKEINIK